MPQFRVGAFRHRNLRAVMIGAAAAFLASGLATAEVVDLSITLDGPQQSPPVSTTGSGTGTATLDTSTNVLSWNITFTNLSSSETLAHLHGPAAQCFNGDLQITLPLGSPIVGSATLSSAQAADVLAGLWYVNIHTTN